MENEQQKALIIPESLFKEPIENKIEKIYNPKNWRQRARETFTLDDKQ